MCSNLMSNPPAERRSLLSTATGDATLPLSTEVDRSRSLVEVGNFLVATRDAGYRSVASAVSEFVDNSIQAGAQSIKVGVAKSGCTEFPIEIAVTDDGTGMNAAELSGALTFGGSSRFGDRSSLGRFGMGLPNAALSLARRVEVYSWQSDSSLLSTLDLDEIVSGHTRFAFPAKAKRPTVATDSLSGTLVRLRRCDRLGYRRPSTIANKLADSLSRTYRHFLGAGLAIVVNDKHLAPADPLFLSTGTAHTAKAFGEPLAYELATEAGHGTVEVTFTELPVEAWCDLSVQQKRRIGITNAANVSIVRAGREVDSGWWFMGGRRRQNYDDWWRCEIRFDPVLDELFGITHTKQQVTPTPYLNDLLAADLGPIANALNARVRRRFELAKTRGPLADAARTAALCSESLPRLGPGPSESAVYRLEVGDVAGTSALMVETEGQDMSVVVNERHPLYRDLLRPLTESATPADRRTAKRFGLFLLALARAEAATGAGSSRHAAAQFRSEWSDFAATYLNA